ncbi:MAG TPA: PHB depolymerase family esterase [Flavobacteriales bacterium]|nr:PHB depolymerase family esterase [Flavobacteriales bacterium]HPH81772.1 PHB depolymerase family esterase [Flavobacteriales bacterium]
MTFNQQSRNPLLFFNLLMVVCFLLISNYLSAQIEQVEKFGSNPGELRCYIYKPKTLLNSDAPLLMVLHGCSQTAEEVSNQSGWNKLADSLGMLVVYPQQHLMNNPSRCFNWFRKEDITRGGGEVESLHQMIQYCMAHYPIDNKRVFVFGLSAGAVMGTILMAAYPEEITAGCSLAGPAIGTWEGSLSQMKDLYDTDEYVPQSQLEKLRACYPGYTGTYPLLLTVQGSNDVLVTIEDQTKQITQWTAANGSDAVPDKIELINNDPNVERSVYTNSQGRTVVIAYQISGMGHVLPINTGNRIDEGGKTGLFSKELNFHLPYWVMREFGMVK